MLKNITTKDILYIASHSDSATEAAKILGIKYDTYKKYAKQLGCFATHTGSKSGTNISNLVKHYFRNIDDKQKAYFLGFMAADGFVSLDGRVGININAVDREFLEKYTKAVGLDSSYIYENKSFQSYNENVESNMVCCVFHCKEFIEDLKKYNIDCNKSHTDVDLFHNIPDAYKDSWLSGYIDGDGCIQQDVYSVSVVGNYKTIMSIKKYISIRLGIDSGRIRQIGDITYTLSYDKKHDVIRILLIYLNTPTYIIRKRNRALDLYNRYVNPYSVPMFSNSAICVDCGCRITKGAMRCKKCAGLKRYQMNSNKPSYNELRFNILKYSFVDIGKKYGVSDNAVRKWCIGYGLPYRSSEIKRFKKSEGFL